MVQSITAIAPGKAITLTAYTNVDIGPTPYYTEFFDRNTGAIVGYCGSGTSCSVSVTQSTATTHSYISYIGSYSATNPPATIAATSNILSCTWLSVYLTASPQYMAPGVKSTVTAHVNTDVGSSPWYIELFDRSTGVNLAVCSLGTTCSTSVVQSVATVHSYVGYVSAYGTANPPPQVQATSPFLGVVWFGITLTASPTALLPGGLTTLTARANADVAPSPYWISIYDKGSGGRMAVCATGTACSVDVRQMVSTINNYVAYVGGSTFSLPPTPVQATSNSVEVTWLSIVLNACHWSYSTCPSNGGAPFFLGPGGPATLTATASQDVGPSSYRIDLWDQTSQTLVMYCTTGSSCSTSVSQPQATIHSFIAYIQCCGTTYPPPSPRATSNSVKVTWLSVALTASKKGAVAGSPITLTATANANFSTSGYVFEIFEVVQDVGTNLASCPGGASCSKAVTESAAGPHSFLAFISDSDPTFRPQNTQATSSLVTAVWVANCASDNSCTPTTFADNIFVYPTINAPVTAANEYAMRAWETREGGGAGCPGQPAFTSPWTNSGGPAGNPINTSLAEPGSTDWNSIPVQIYHDYGGQTCWYWGIKANGDTLLNGKYGTILTVLKTPSSDNYTQCVNLSNAVSGSPWGTHDFTALC